MIRLITYAYSTRNQKTEKNNHARLILDVQMIIAIIASNHVSGMVLPL